MDSFFSNNLYQHYDQLSARLFEEHRNAIMSLKTEADAKKYIADTKQKIDRIFAFSKRPEPESRITGTFRANGTLVDKVLFRCDENRWCSGWFIRREQTDRMPGLLMACGHSSDGKFSEAYQMVSFGLALKGFAVLIFDPLGQGEMSQYKDDLAASPQHNLMGRICTLSGTTLATDFVHDAKCAIDTLLARPEVLSGPVSVTGNSGGGQMTYYLHGLDERVGYSAPSCHMNTFRTIFRNEQPTDAESSPVGLLAAGCDRPDFGILGAPKPFCLIDQDNDYIDIRGVKVAYENIRHIYKLLGHEENCEFYLGHGKHGFIPNGREAAYGFFTRRVFGKEDSKEPEGMVPVTPEEGNVAPTGKVIDIPGFKSLPQIHLERWQKTSFTSDPEKISAFLKQTLKISSLQQEVPDYRTLRTAYGVPDTVCTRWAWNTDKGSPAVAVLLNTGFNVLVPKMEKAHLYVAENSALEELKTRYTGKEHLLGLDMRGIGESESGAGPIAAWNKYDDIFGREYFLDNSGRLMGDLLAAGRVRDILSALALLTTDAGCQDITLEGNGHAGMMIAFAAAMGPLPGVTKIRISGVPDSFMNEHRELRSPVFLFGMMKHFDLPQLYQAVRHFHPGTEIILTA